MSATAWLSSQFAYNLEPNPEYDERVHSDGGITRGDIRKVWRCRSCLQPFYSAKAYRSHLAGGSLKDTQPTEEPT